jgi:hypothetical protein
MSMNKHLLNFIVEDGLLARIEDFRFKNRFPTRAAAIKWLLDWALKQKPSVKGLPREPEEERPAAVLPFEPPVIESSVIEPPAIESSVIEPRAIEPIVIESRIETPVPAAAKPERAAVVSQESMMQVLRDQGYEVGDAARHPDGQERILVRSQDRSAWVNAVQELQDLAAARITLAEVSARRSAGR